MKNLKKFNTQQEFNVYKNSDNYILPNVSLINDVNKSVSYKQRYTKLQYIASTQTGGQYISLGNELAMSLKANDEVSIELKYFLQGNGKDNNNQATIFTISNQDYGYMVRRNSGVVHFKASNNLATYTQTSYTNTNNSVYYRTINVNTFGFTLNNNYDTSSSDIKIVNFRKYPISFFVSIYDSLYRYSESRIYYCKIKVNNVLYYDLIPMIDNQTNQIGLYCNVHNCLYAGQGDESLVYEI